MGRQVAIAGYARLAEGTASRALYEYLTLSAIVEVETHTVVRAGSTIVSDVAKEWLHEQLVGVDLLQEPSPFVSRIESDYWGLSAPAIAQAYRDMVRRYRSRLADELAAT